MLEFGDISFLGNGPDGMLSIGIEYKTLNDALTCMTNGRFAGHQLPGLMQTYQHYWLLVEGIVKCSGDGELLTMVRGEWQPYQQGGRHLMWRDYWHWLMSLQQMAGVRLATTSTLKESVIWVASLYSWWQKQWSEHRTMQTIYIPPVNGGGPLGITRVSLSRLWAMQLPGIGQDKSKLVAMAFPTGLELANADEDRWQLVNGIGKTLAHKVVGAIRGKQ